MRCCPPPAWPWLVSILGAPNERRQCGVSPRRLISPVIFLLVWMGLRSHLLDVQYSRTEVPGTSVGQRRGTHSPTASFLKSGLGGPALAHQLLL